MRIPAYYIIASVAMLAEPAALASNGDDLHDFLKSAREELNAFRDKAVAERNDFRDKALHELAAWTLQKWEPKPMETPVAPPHDDKPVPPVVIPQDAPTPQPKDEPVRDNPEVVTPPLPEPPAPSPIFPVAPPATDPADFTFLSYGTTYHVDASPKLKTGLPHTFSRNPGAEMAQALEMMDTDLFDRLYSSLASEAIQHNLSDWAYLKLTRHFAESFLPGNVNAQRFLQGLLLISTGYDVRFAEASSEGRLYMLVGCRELILNQYYYTLDGAYFYPFEKMPDKGTKLTTTRFGTTRVMSAQPSGKEVFDYAAGPTRKIIVCAHTPHCDENRCSSPKETYTLTGNANRMAFFSECPTYILPGNDYSQWNSYAQTQLSDEYKAQLFPSMARATAGMNSLEKVNFLMRFVEAFEYAYDSDIWGEDRAFFADETLYYPYRDCEDGAILLTRLVRDLTDLPVALVYYPGHMATAIAFDMPVSGPYINHNGHRYTICDPTIYYADAGVQMPPDKVDASKAILIPLDSEIKNEVRNR